jgi:hypothetical protein
MLAIAKMVALFALNSSYKEVTSERHTNCAEGASVREETFWLDSFSAFADVSELGEQAIPATSKLYVGRLEC